MTDHVVQAFSPDWRCPTNPSHAVPTDLSCDERTSLKLPEVLLPEHFDENFFLLDAHAFGTGERLVGGLINMPYREIVTIASDGGIGKSLVAADLSVCVALGQRFLGQETLKGKVLYLDFEQDRATMFQRLQKLAIESGATMPSLQDRIFYRNFTDYGTPLHAVQADLLKLSAKIEPDLIVLDSWASGTQIDSNNEQDVHAAFGLLQPFLRFGTVLILAHVSDRGAKERNPANVKPSGHRQQRQRPRRIYGLTGSGKRGVLELGVSKSNEPIDATRLKIQRIDTRGGQGLRHVLLDDMASAGIAAPARDSKGSHLPPALAIVRETVRLQGRISRTDMMALLESEGGLSNSSADKALRAERLTPISDCVRLEPDKSDSRKKWLVWKGSIILALE